MIIVFGSLNIDLYMPLDTLPTAGSQATSLHDYDSYPGGKGANQAFAAARAGAKTVMVGTIGDDGFGRRCTQNLKREGVLGSGIGTVNRPTGCALILPGSGEDKTVISSPAANLESRSDQIPNEILTPEHTVVAQLLVPTAEIIDLFTRARDRGTTTVLNASPPQSITADLLKLTDLLVVNETELKTAAQTLGHNENMENPSLMDILCEHYDLDCITTCGSQGVRAHIKGHRYTIQAAKIDVKDVNGAGDCFIGYFLAMMDRGFDISAALHHAAMAGSIACTARGAQSAVPFFEDVAARLETLDPPVRM